MRITRITLVHKKIPRDQNVNELLLKFGESLGLFSSRDKDKSCYRIFIVLLKALKYDVELSSDDIASQTKLTRGTVVHHLNKLMETGIVTAHRGKYFLNVKNLADLVLQMKEGINTVMDDLHDMALEIDSSLDLDNQLI